MWKRNKVNHFDTRVYGDIKNKLRLLEASETDQKSYVDSLPEDSVCRKNFEIIKSVNDITRSIQNSNLTYLRQKFKESKVPQQGK